MAHLFLELHNCSVSSSEYKAVLSYSSYNCVKLYTFENVFKGYKKLHWPFDIHYKLFWGIYPLHKCCDCNLNASAFHWKPISNFLLCISWSEYKLKAFSASEESAWQVQSFYFFPTASYSYKDLNNESDSQDQPPLHMSITAQMAVCWTTVQKATINSPASHKERKPSPE